MNSAAAKPKIIIICGPTGIGKTTVAVDLAQHFAGQIIGADSMQVYKYMDIGTAKPTAAEQARVVHHMVDFVEPDDLFDAARYAARAREKIIELDRQRITPFVVGGTGLYIKALLHGLFDEKVSDPEIRNRLKAEAGDRGIQCLYERLGRWDPETANRLHPNDTYRILRALEVIEATGQAISAHHKKHGFFDQPFESLKIGLEMDRALLYERINRRVDAMISAGFLDEVKGLLARGYSTNLKPMQSIGYRHMVDYIERRLNWDECVRTLKRDHRRYAKRQLTWFGADSEIIWKEPGQVEALKSLVENFMREV
ncbi:MAG: tRNA (adenosine(37)-N6)-dimethylallyltransferase MiaA [Desulfobacterales bacterium]|jgi:tRNA dimethylallyltransferase